MAAEGGSSSGTLEVDVDDFFGAGSGWVEARTTCDHLPSLCSDLSQIPLPDSPCSRCHHPAENWLCLSCKDVFCSRFINKHMLRHYEESGHCLALSFRYDVFRNPLPGGLTSIGSCFTSLKIFQQ
ncbi:Zn-finger in ubiquitin-hydrolases protein [Musa troglodytarum]|uniref:Zn-finger in ubiquitin-hydrolases protein n=1 Tax=Musa troglodytarum TaxID=320322 RepID=A0A9E7E8Q0_9LILI|nr:Zn-finger in ubiquitin-hydrolases protein [Musa troglodytarum]